MSILRFVDLAPLFSESFLHQAYPQHVQFHQFHPRHSLKLLQPISPKSKDEKSAILKPTCHYVFLSPIFDSISKKGYKHSFSNKDLEEAGINGIINERVVALGGVTPEYIPQLRAWNFGGAAFLGDVWNRRTDAKWTEYLAGIKKKLSPGNAQNKLNSSNIW